MLTFMVVRIVVCAGIDRSYVGVSGGSRTLYWRDSTYVFLLEIMDSHSLRMKVRSILDRGVEVEGSDYNGLLAQYSDHLLERVMKKMKPKHPQIWPRLWKSYGAFVLSGVAGPRERNCIPFSAGYSSSSGFERHRVQGDIVSSAACSVLQLRRSVIVH